MNNKIITFVYNTFNKILISVKLIKNLLASFVLITLVICCSKQTSKISDRNLFTEYISNVTNGIISTKDHIQLVLTKPVENWISGNEISSDNFEITPKVKGTWIVQNTNSISFIPKEQLKPNTEYFIKVKLKNFIKIDSKYDYFTFKVKTIKQDFVIQTNAIQSYNKNWQFLTGNITSSDFINLNKAKQLITANFEGRNLKISFDHTNKEAKYFSFKIDSIKRPNTTSTLEIKTNGKPIDVSQENTYKLNIIGKNNFEISKVSLNDGYISVNFSDPLAKNQNLNGLVRLGTLNNLRTTINGNSIRIYFNKNSKKSTELEIFAGIKSQDGIVLTQNYTKKIAFQELKPEVKLLKNGTILPHSKQLKFNFEAVNLKAVDITIYKIYENNVLQFLQNNNYSGDYMISQVARPIAKKKINLTSKITGKLNSWNSFAIDLSSIINIDKGAIYKVKISFKKKYSLYNCPEDNKNSQQEEDEEEEFDKEKEDSLWDNQEFYNNEYDNYNWRERDNPCHVSYYKDRTVSTNILASNIGITVKKGINNDYFIVTSDLRSTDLLSNVMISFYDYQKQQLATANTNDKGIVNLKLKRKAYFIKATKNGESTYIKLSDGNALSVSKFDVAGMENKKGLKGFIYGERGVWRPGDSLHLNFILNDNANKLPNNHPIKMELFDPHGMSVFRKITRVTTNNKIFTFKIPTQTDHPTGNWLAKVSVGGAVFNKNIKIETIKPNRLKLNIDLKDKILTKQPTAMDLSVKWLHGAVASNLKVNMMMKLSSKETKFKAFPDYTFDDPARKFKVEKQEIFEGRVNENGTAQINFNTSIEKTPPGMLNASFITKTYEKGGNFSTDVFTKPYSPYISYVGLSTPKGDRTRNMLLTDVKHRFDVATVDQNGKPIAISDLNVKIYKVNHSWWWDASKANLSQYDGSSYKKAVFEKTIRTNSSGKSSFDFILKYPDWGRFLVRIVNKKSGHATGKMIFIDWPGWAGKSRKGNPDEATMLAFACDKEKYNVGESVKVTIPTAINSKALITIENGTKVLAHYWVPTKKGNTDFSFEVTPEMAPNVFVSVSTIQQHASTQNDLPIRRYGINNISVENPATRLYPEISMPKVLRPETDVKIKIRETTGKQMTYTLAIVDEGLLDLTRFKTPTPWDTFYEKQALGVKTWDIYDDVIGAYGGNINQVFSIGGDGILAGSKNKKAIRFKPVVLHLGPFNLNQNETKTHKIKLPKYIGSVRTMVVAHNSIQNAYGCSEKTTPVRKPLMILASMPSKVSPKEIITIPVTVFALDKKIKNARVSISNNSKFKIIGNQSQEVNFSKVGEQLCYFKVKVLENGIGKINIKARGYGENASYGLDINAYNPNTQTNTVEKVIVEPNSSKETLLTTFGITGTNKAIIELSSLPNIDFEKRLAYLIQYPHGCAEQTTSKVFPQLFLSSIFDLSTIKKQEIQKNIQDGISKLIRYQKPSGGFSYWQNESYSDQWITSYVGHFMFEAQKKGYMIPLSFKDKWVNFQKNASRKWNTKQGRQTMLSQAYRLYTLAMSGNPDLSSMNRLRETLNLTTETRSRLAAAYAIIGKKTIAKIIANKTNNTRSTKKISTKYSYGSKVRNQAMLLETMLSIDKTQKAKEIADKIAKELSGKSYMSTQSTAYALLALSKFITHTGGKSIDAQISINGISQKAKTTKSLIKRTLLIKNGKNIINIKNNASNKVYINLINKGVLPVGEEKSIQRGLKANLTFTNLNGLKISVDNLKQSTDFIAEIDVTNTTNDAIDNIALTQIIPSGWEFINTRFTQFGTIHTNKVRYEDIKDDRINFYFNLKPKQTKVIKVMLNASYLGSYYMPGFQCEAMYDNSYLVHSKGKWINVIP